MIDLVLENPIKVYLITSGIFAFYFLRILNPKYVEAYLKNAEAAAKGFKEMNEQRERGTPHYLYWWLPVWA